MDAKSEEVSTLLKISSYQSLKKFLHQCVDELLGRNFEDFSNYSNDSEMTAKQAKNARKFIQNLYRQYFFEEDDSKFRDVLDPFDSSYKECVLQCYHLRKLDIIRAILREKMSQSPMNWVENIDWKLKWVLGSSKLAFFCEPLLQLDLHCVEEEGSDMSLQPESKKLKSLSFELNLDEVDMLIKKLEDLRVQLNT